MIIVTGGAGFIGSNIVKQLNARGRKDVLVVDDLTDGTKFKNLLGADLLDYIDKNAFLPLLEANHFPVIDAIFHEGACSDTTEWDGRYMMENNYEYSKRLLHVCIKKSIPLIYASSAAVYGGGSVFKENIVHEAPLNVYGYSKFLFDQYVRQNRATFTNQVVGLRYFNVYGPGEFHKGTMASVAYHHQQQILNHEPVKLFEGYEGYGDGQQQRDFIYVADAVKVNLWFMDHPEKSGIFNCGTGRAQAFNDIATSVIAWHGQGTIEYIPFPEHLKGRYQSFTQADITALRQAGYQEPFLSVQEGVKTYLDALHGKSA